MIVGRSTAELVFVKAIIYWFSYLGLICLIYFYLALSIGGTKWVVHPISIAVEILGGIEILFYLFWFLPYRHYLHSQPPEFPTPLLREERQELFYKSLGVKPDLQLFAKKWMCGGSVDDLRRENLKEWMLWALFNREGPPGDDDEELNEYCEMAEGCLGRSIKPGWGPIDSLRLNFQPFTISHRSLTFYGLVGTIDFVASMTLLCLGFSFYRQPRLKFFRSFPFRPLTLLSCNESASPNLSYWYRPHTSTKHRPIVFMHGMGVGLSIYIPLFRLLPKEIGILAIEVLPASSRITESALLADDLIREIGDIITQQDLSDIVFVGHSYGTFFARMFLDSRHLSSRLSRIVLVDPCAVLLHVPDLAYNFTRKKPVYANEWQLWWGAETEPDIAFTLAKRLCWRSHVLWREDMLRYPTTVILAGDDCLLHSEAIATYITKGAPNEWEALSGANPELQWDWNDREKWRRSPDVWTGKGLELIWYEGYDHAQAIFGGEKLGNIAHVIERYCEMGDKMDDEITVGGSVHISVNGRTFNVDTPDTAAFKKETDI